MLDKFRERKLEEIELKSRTMTNSLMELIVVVSLNDAKDYILQVIEEMSEIRMEKIIEIKLEARKEVIKEVIDRYEKGGLSFCDYLLEMKHMYGYNTFSQFEDNLNNKE